MDTDREVSDEDIRAQLTSDREDARYKMVMHLLETHQTLSPELHKLIQTLTADGSREVRTLARQLLAEASRLQDHSASDLNSSPPPTDPYPGSSLLALCSLGSSITGIMGTAMSILSLYLEGKFPFPAPIDVLIVLNLFFTVPYFVITLLLLFSGKLQKQIAIYYAYFSLFLVALLVLGLRSAFNIYWAMQFSQADQLAFATFLSPSQLIAAFMPVICGQSLLIYYVGPSITYSHRANAVDTETATR